MQNPQPFGFGATAAQGASTGLFGTATSNAAGGLFGAPASTPAFGVGGGLFGAQNTANTAATPTLFGNTNTPAFGTAPNVSLAGFGTAPTSAPTVLPTFGAQQSIGPTFGGMATVAPTFGTTTSAPSNFGLAPSVTTSFGVTASAAPTFGALSTPTSAFGIATTTTTPAFGSISTTTPSFGLTTNAAPNFGGLSSTAPAFGITSSTSTFGAHSTAAPVFGFASGATTTSTVAAPTTGLGFSLGATLTSSAPITASAPVGLGGLATAQTKIVTTQKDVTPKDQPLPNEFLQTVESFKELVKQQKIHSSDIAKCSIRDFRKVEQDITHLTALLGEVESQLQKNRQLAENLKYDTAKCLQNVEIAQRTQDTPPGLQYENIAPLKFFLNLADSFERDMQVLKVQIEGADNYVKNYRTPNPLTPQDLALGMRRLHESFVALAGRLHSVHNQIESQKEAYLQTRRQMFNDLSNPFDNLYKPQEENFKHILNYSPPKVATGPTPFSNLSLGNTQLANVQQNQNTMAYSTPTTTTPGFGTMGFGTGFGGQTTMNATQLFGSSSFNQNLNNFQLQKPPTGNKRGKQ